MVVFKEDKKKTKGYFSITFCSDLMCNKDIKVRNLCLWWSNFMRTKYEQKMLGNNELFAPVIFKNP